LMLFPHSLAIPELRG